MNWSSLLNFTDEIDIKLLKRNEYQRNEYAGTSKVKSMRKTLANGGTLKPVSIVKLKTPIDDKPYLVVDGHHRLTAYELEGRKTIPYKQL